MVTLQGPYAQGIRSHFTGLTLHTRLGCQRSALCCRVLPHAGTEGLGRSLHALDVPQGQDMTGKEGVEQEKESCRAPSGTLLHIPVSRLWTASPQASGERQGHFKSDLFLALDVLSSGEAECPSEGQPYLGCREPGALAQPLQLPLQYQRQVLA